MRIAIIGAGNVGGALGKGWARTLHLITYGVPYPADDKHRTTAEAAGGAGVFSVARVVQQAEAIVLAVPFDAVNNALAAAGDLRDRLPGRPLGKRALHPRLVGLRSSVVISLSMLVLSTAVWGAVYLLNSATLR